MSEIDADREWVRQFVDSGSHVPSRTTRDGSTRPFVDPALDPSHGKRSKHAPDARGRYAETAAYVVVIRTKKSAKVSKRKAKHERRQSRGSSSKPRRGGGVALQANVSSPAPKSRTAATARSFTVKDRLLDFDATYSRLEEVVRQS